MKKQGTGAGTACCWLALLVLLFAIIFNTPLGTHAILDRVDILHNTEVQLSEKIITQPVLQQDYVASFRLQGLDRCYRVHLPAGYKTDASWPLVIMLHASGSSGSVMNGLTAFDLYADRHGFVVVYPDAAGSDWNDGRGDLFMLSQRENIDDVSFIGKLIDRLVAELNIDSRAVFASGFSNGGMMCQRLAMQLSHRIAAIASVASNMPAVLPSIAHPSRPVPVLMINGTEDPIIPWQGGNLVVHGLHHGSVLSVQDSIRFWTEFNSCDGQPYVVMLPDASQNDGTVTSISIYAGGADVVLYTVHGGGHCWPGGVQYAPSSIIGYTSRDFIATEAIIDFFKRSLAR